MGKKELEQILNCIRHCLYRFENAGYGRFGNAAFIQGEGTIRSGNPDGYGEFKLRLRKRFSLQVAEYLLKPFNRKELENVLVKLINNWIQDRNLKRNNADASAICSGIDDDSQRLLG